VLVSDKKARNGVFHTLNHPLIPPPSIIDELFLFPDFFSTITSAVQQVHHRGALDWSYDHEASEPGKPKFKGTPLATFFAPTNGAFHLLPPRLKFFLFSPIGHRALTKVLSYHYVPDTLLLTEFLYKGKKHHDDDDDTWGFQKAVEAPEYFATADDPSFHKEFEISPALPNSTLKIEIDKSKFLPVEGECPSHPYIR
jgi:uncharacterized surface protein with fasciclin (FAS1) repeats